MSCDKLSIMHNSELVWPRKLMILLFLKYTIHVSSFITLSILAIIFTTYIIVNNSPGENVCMSLTSRRNETSCKCTA